MNPPSIHPSDPAKYRQQYINNLRLQASNDQLNLNANQIYSKTGQTPSPLPDVRSTTEKEADVERLKIEVRSRLAEVMDGDNANNAVMTLSPKQLVFVANQIDSITKDLKSRYALGVPSQIFVQYIRRLMTKESQTNGVDLGLQQSTGEDILLSNQQIANTLIDKDDLQELEEAIQNVNGGAQLRKYINEITEVLPNEETENKVYGLNRGNQAQSQIDLNNALQNIPTKYQFNKLLRKFKTAKAMGDDNAVRDYVRQFRDMLNIDEEELQLAKSVKSRISNVIDDEAFFDARENPPEKPEISRGKTHHHTIRQEVADEMRRNGIVNIRGFSADDILNKTKVKDKAYVNAESVRSIHDELGLGGQKEGRMKGKGIKKGRVIPKVALNEGIQRTVNYVPFGRYIIQRHRLADNTLMMRHKRGGAIIAFPTHKISTALSRIFKKLIKNEMPSYEEVGNLSKDEQAFLHKVIKHAQLEDQMRIPSPNKSEEEQQNDRFEILKGEISAGNDNPELIKEFKQLLFKFIQEGKIPRRQGHEILMDLTSLGF
jgi:hypothetical protein